MLDFNLEPARLFCKFDPKMKHIPLTLTKAGIKEALDEAVTVA